MLMTYISSPQTVNTNDAIKFDINKIWTTACIKHPSGSENTSLAKQGYYKIDFNASGASIIATPPNATTFQLYNGDKVVAGALSTNFSDGTTDEVAFSFSTVVPVNRSCDMANSSAELTIKNIGQPINLSNANLIITRLGELNGSKI